MEPIYDEAVWRERNFYRAEDAPDVATPAPKPAPAPSIVDTVTSPIKDFGDWLRPAGAWNWGRVVVVVGGLCLVGYLVGKRK
jgi:hypothetical protein